MDINKSGSSERANQIRAEIARLQQELASLGEGSQSEYSPEFFNWINSQEKRFINEGRFEYFNVDNEGRLVFDPSLAANQVELLNFKKFSESQELKRKEREELRKKEAVAKYKKEEREKLQKQTIENRKIFEANAMKALGSIRQDPTKKIANSYVEYLREKGLLPEGYGTQTSTQPTRVAPIVPGMTNSTTKPPINMPPAWS